MLQFARDPDSVFVKSKRNHKTAIICLFSEYSIYSVYDLKKSPTIIYYKYLSLLNSKSFPI